MLGSDDLEARPSVAVAKQFLTCGECGWVHYVMSREEKSLNDRFVTRYRLSEDERFIYESAFRQCLYCEAPLSEFRLATARDLKQAEGHLVTPVLMDLDDLNLPTS